MLLFLKRTYPVHRMKYNRKFKRTIVLETGVYLLCDKSSTEKLVSNLGKTLKVIFDCDEKIIKGVLKSFLNLK